MNWTNEIAWMRCKIWRSSNLNNLGSVNSQTYFIHDYHFLTKDGQNENYMKGLKQRDLLRVDEWMKSKVNSQNITVKSMGIIVAESVTSILWKFNFVNFRFHEWNIKKKSSSLQSTFASWFIRKIRKPSVSERSDKKKREVSTWVKCLLFCLEKGASIKYDNYKI